MKEHRCHVFSLSPLSSGYSIPLECIPRESPRATHSSQEKPETVKLKLASLSGLSDQFPKRRSSFCFIPFLKQTVQNSKSCPFYSERLS